VLWVILHKCVEETRQQKRAMCHADAVLLHECRQAEVSLLGPPDRPRSGMASHGEPQSEGEELARECASIAMLPSPARAQEC
jgi:hypothetical protein